MNVVILHCHYERGGVTQVVENHVQALHKSADVDRIVLVSGQRASGLSESTLSIVECLAVEDFDYDDIELPKHSTVDRGKQISHRLQELFSDAGIGRDASVLHWHNHSLGKNSAAPAAITELAQTGWRLLLQIHDFAEDNRPQNYLQLIRATGVQNSRELDTYLYPRAPQIHYAGLTQADASVIASLGVPVDRTHCLPNSVAAPLAEAIDPEAALRKVRELAGLPVDARWTLYPVRGIRRKNVGEFLLLSRFLNSDTFAGLTLCPATAVEKRSYDRWKTVANEVAPRAIFDAAHLDGLSFAENLAASDFVISTSVAEGFGMAFLEPWLAGRRVVARRLHTVTDDFESMGLNLSQLYDQIPIPGDASWLRCCRREIEQAFKQAWSAVPDSFRPCFEDDARDAGDHIDFAKLTPARQIEVLRRAAHDGDFELSILRSSKKLVDCLRNTTGTDEELIKHNADVVAGAYAVQRQGSELLTVYQQLLNTQPSSQVDSPQCEQAAVNLVSRVRPFFPCRTEIPDE